jgi:GNAT superfamily N-acetyltransferase
MALERLAREARVVEQAWAAAWAALGASADEPRSVVDDLPNFLRVYTPGAPDMLLNLVMRYASAGPVSGEAVEAVIAPYRRNALPFQWWLTRSAEPAGLREQLRALGMRTWGGSTSMLLDFDGWRPAYPTPPAEVELLRVATPEDARDALRVTCDVFVLPWQATARWTVSNPRFTAYLARWGGRAVAALTTMCADDAVLLFNVATVPRARRRGIAGNLALAALRDAQAAGCARAALTATPEARRLYEELGFRACGLMEQWVPGYGLEQALRRGQRGYTDQWESTTP